MPRQPAFALLGVYVVGACRGTVGRGAGLGAAVCGGVGWGLVGVRFCSVCFRNKAIGSV